MVSSKLWMIAHYGLLWFLYGKLPKHASPKRASWKRYLFTYEDSPSIRRTEGIRVPALLEQLRRQRLKMELAKRGVVV